MLGGAIERRYRKLRPDVLRLPWGTLARDTRPGPEADAGRLAWTSAAFQEHRTAAACAATLSALIAIRTPVDLLALASRFPLDELAHVEMCARLAGELGGGAPVFHQGDAMVALAREDFTPKLQAAELVVRFFCIGEAISIPLLRAGWHAATHPLVKGVLGRIVKDEAAHGQFGWMFLDWLGPELSDADRAQLGEVAGEAIGELEARWAELEAQPTAGIPALGMIETSTYLPLARASLVTHVLEPLAARGIHPSAP